MRAVSLLLFVLAGVSSHLFTDETNALLPRLYHLDDYDRCVSQRNGLYCLGIFELSPIHPSPSPTYQYIKEYSVSPFAFNRSLLHRGYCVSSRCGKSARERNATLRFERCASSRARRLALTARLHTLHHCTTHHQHAARAAQPPHHNQLLFMHIVAAILALNIIATLYDVATPHTEKKIGILTAWSVRASWRRLTATHEGGDPRLKELEYIHEVRVILLLLTLFVHAYAFHFQYHVSNPQFLEHLSYRPDGVLFSSGTSLVQVFILISNFLLGYNLLIYLETHKLSLTMLPVLVLKRFVRIVPVHMLIIGFTATWWPRMFSGPFYSQIEDQSAICRRKFWSHVFFYNNLVDKHDQCLIPSWFLPVDMHLYILACILIIVMQHRRQQARRLLGIGFIISSLACGVVCYFTGWQAMLYFAMSDQGRGFFKTVVSYGEFYTSSWGALPACFLGLYMAYLFYDLKETKLNDNKWLKLLHNVSLPLMATWMIHVGTIARRYKMPLVTAGYNVVDRLQLLAFTMVFIIGVFKINGFWHWVGSWKGWRIPARLSLPVMLGHWLILNYIVARPVAYYTSEFVASLDWLATVVFSHIIAVPISLLVEIPVQRFVSQFI